ncbi:hypothetical protein SAMD00023353_8800030 [Rosellinia necatrix]|uniref:Uncharacterized protein n=1 Tax=Rosellinia necatrix TaxID=77044 RepID=A0A1S8ABC5_ROSNE|nr:hypothetical protein SAMD00023353_8800030 [Rosellinia necatrix]
MVYVVNETFSIRSDPSSSSSSSASDRLSQRRLYAYSYKIPRSRQSLVKSLGWTPSISHPLHRLQMQAGGGMEVIDNRAESVQCEAGHALFVYGALQTIDVGRCPRHVLAKAALAVPPRYIGVNSQFDRTCTGTLRLSILLPVGM